MCCCPCLYCKNVSDIGESVPLYVLLGCVFSPLGVCMLRKKTRERYGIDMSEDSILVRFLGRWHREK